MLYSKFQGNWPFGSGKNIGRFLNLMEVVVILVMRPRYRQQTFVPLSMETSHTIWL